ncbi:urea ABC transporter permease subunit UrtC [Klebsiella pneumoniae]|uniref:Urea ABC transporter permease subunit UrtC n=1 Tax=Klebsiella pneumoniae TaxID=573 RepID=A0A939NQT2_KLEPN|nr:urea ABC transporter permease subunit UrtC [Klebsiella pneumoniae]
MPLTLDLFRLNLIGKYLTYAFVAVGLVLCWGYSGILSSGRASFGLGGYCMAMFLKLEASSPAETKMQTTPGIPDFMDWNQLTALPSFWQPFHSFSLTILAILIVPTICAWILGSAMFKRRVGGVLRYYHPCYLRDPDDSYYRTTGLHRGINGITDLRTLLGWDIRTDSARYILYFINAVLLMLVVSAGYFIVNSKLGRLMVAIRDKEDRVRFSGYDVANIKTVVFCISALFSAIGGAMFTLQVGFMSPGLLALLLQLKWSFSVPWAGEVLCWGSIWRPYRQCRQEQYFRVFPELWTIAMGLLFIAVVLIFPKGLAGLYQQYIHPIVMSLLRKRV